MGRIVASKLSIDKTLENGDSSVVQRRTRDRKVAGSIPGKERREKFSSPMSVNFPC